MNELDFVGEYCRIRDGNALSDPEFTLFASRQVPIVYSEFFELYNRYIQALNRDIQMLRRHVRSLHAWKEVELSHPADIEGPVWGCVLVDYIEPTVRSAIDLPIEIKEKLYQGAWKLTVIAKNGIQGVASIDDLEKERRSKYQLLDDYGMKGPELDCLKECLGLLYGKEQAEAYELEKLHGEKHHDVMPPIHAGYPRTRVEKDASLGMMVVYHTYDRLDWHSLITTIDHQRVLAQKAYMAFYSYVKILINNGLQVG